jgi:hypothetical protein
MAGTSTHGVGRSLRTSHAKTSGQSDEGEDDTDYLDAHVHRKPPSSYAECSGVSRYQHPKWKDSEGCCSSTNDMGDQDSIKRSRFLFTCHCIEIVWVLARFVVNSDSRLVTLYVKYIIDLCRNLGTPKWRNSKLRVLTIARIQHKGGDQVAVSSCNIPTRA